MKLYTESEIISAYEKAELCHLRMESFIELMTPIELPSDEEIEKQAEHEDTYSKKCAFTRGAKWMLRKTFGGNNEQQ